MAQSTTSQDKTSYQAIRALTGAILLLAALWFCLLGTRNANAQTAIADSIAQQAALGSAQAQDHKVTTVRAAELINNLRVRLDACGDKGMLAVSDTDAESPSATTTQSANTAIIPDRPALRWNPLLDQAAKDHALAMANLGFFDHTDPQGRTVGQRVQDTGYRWRVVGENLAAGQRTIEEAVQGWLLSTGHCEIMLDARFTEFGLARTNANGLDPYGSYWTLVVAQPKARRTRRIASTQ